MTKEDRNRIALGVMGAIVIYDAQSKKRKKKREVYIYGKEIV